MLIIEDSATVRAMLECLVEQEPGCSVIGVAPTIPVARRLIVEQKPNLITLDLGMPGIDDGLTFLDELKVTANAPVIVLSSSTVAGSSAWKDALARGAAACFDKNRVIAEAERFRGVLRKALEKRQRDLLRVSLGNACG